MRPREAAMRDLRRACIHEYAHWAVARHFGAAGFVTIVSHAAGHPRYGGRFQMHGDLADDEWRVVALAGAVAECCADDPDVAAHLVIRYLRSDPSALSPVDAQLAAGFADRDVERCLAVVKAAWHEIAGEADARVHSAVEAARATE
jgi:hypothetical protein